MTPLLVPFLTQAATVSAIVTVLMLLTRCGRGAVAGLATAALSAPTLVLLADAHGPAFAQQAALGTLLSTPLCARLATAGLRWLARQGPRQSRPWPGQTVGAIALAGLMSSGVCTLAPTLGPVGSGLVSGLPVVAAWTMLGTQRHSGTLAAQGYVQAFRRGLDARSVMGLVFLAGVTALGAGWAMALALLASGAVGALRQGRAAAGQLPPIAPASHSAPVGR